jgi:CspA family cold shock protein
VQGVVKVYDPGTRIGVIVRDDDRSEVYLRPGAIEGSMFRMLRQGQRINFDLHEDHNGRYAVNVRFGSDGF